MARFLLFLLRPPMKHTTVFRQLMLNIVTPLVLCVILFSCISYYYNKKELEKYYAESRQRIVEEVKNLLSLYDFSMSVHEHEYSGRMKSLSEGLADRFSKENIDPSKADLYRLVLDAGFDTTSEFVYIIDTNAVIVNTTFEKDRGLDFGKKGTFFINFFRKVREGKKFSEDRFSNELATGKIKKYAYQPTHDGRYVLELGFNSARAIELRELLNSKIGSISQNYDEIKNIHLLSAIAGTRNSFVPDEDSAVFNAVLKKKSSARVTKDLDTLKVYTDYIYLDMMNTNMFDGYVIEISSTDIKERRLVENEFRKFGFIFAITVIPLVVIVYFRARKITNPIKKLIAKVKIIRGGNLSERITPEGNNEITELSENFNTMVEELQESYEGLEQKVRDRTLEISHQKELIEEKNKEITDSINYAQRIQRALLAGEQLLKENLKDHFVFFQPKDIVSGDFYWGAKVADGSFVLVTADSTGHGVPGAIMSMLNISCLNEAVSGQELTEADEILNYTRSKIIGHLANDGSAEGGKDGMDCSLVKFDFANNKVSYSAANNPVWLVRNGGLIEFDPDNMPVGKHDRDKTSFTQHSIEVQKGDVIYTLTDGFPDQFGGPKGKKFMYKKLKEFLVSISSLPMNEQKQELHKTLHEWMAWPDANGMAQELEQVDDVCIIGVRI
jgi:serine phosphatase RsbU (regulator of sigma subunit)